MPREHSIGWPVDAIVDTGEHIALGCYQYSGERSGRVFYLDRETHSVASELPTTGTLALCFHAGLLYCANAQNISVYRADELVRRVDTLGINTYIDCAEHVAVASTDGHLRLYDYSLSLVKELAVSNDTVWVVKRIGDAYYIGTEEGLAYRYRLATDRLEAIGGRRSGIIDFLEIDGLLYVSSYDDSVEVFSIADLAPVKAHKKVGSLWKMVPYGQFILAASMYDGLQIFDREFNLLRRVPTGSICYGLCLSQGRAVWSSFYDNAIYSADLSALTDPTDQSTNKGV
ncbi:hypothetical protein PAPHI01_0228 [Pancytospora philotis]|nr:hypothetical protein PAPHI01_0228 [Pancytospora philotis]